MHYCTLLITKELPSENEIAEIMQPYCYDNIKYDEETDELITPYPVFTWDYYDIGGRYAGALKLKIDENNKDYEWNYYAKENRNKRLFYFQMLSNLQEMSKGKLLYSEEKYFAYMGWRDDFLYVDGARINDLLNFDDVNCFICIDSNGNAIARKSWDGHDFIVDEKFDDKLAEIKKNSQGMFATILDVHD